MSDFSKFGVHAVIGGSGGILQPKLTYKFRVTFDQFGDGNLLRELTQAVQSCSRPSWSQEEVEVHSYNSRVRIGGKHDWDALTLSCRDNLDNSVVSAVGAQIQKQINHFEQTSAIAGADYKFTMEIQSLDGTHGAPLEIWLLEGCWLTASNYGEADYTSTGDLQLVEMTIRFDNATQIDGGSSVPTVGGNPFPEEVGGFTQALAAAFGG